MRMVEMVNGIWRLTAMVVLAKVVVEFGFQYDYGTAN